MLRIQVGMRTQTRPEVAIQSPPEGMVPNFEPKIDLKKGEICIY